MGAGEQGSRERGAGSGEQGDEDKKDKRQLS